MKRYNTIIVILLCGMFAMSFSSCKKKVNPTTVEVEDQDRHYYPIQQGQDLDLNYGILNTGNDPLVITEVQPSCGCMIVDKKSPQVILPHKRVMFTLSIIVQRMWAMFSILFAVMAISSVQVW